MGSWTHPWPVRLCSLHRRSSLATLPGQVARLACPGTISHACLPAPGSPSLADKAGKLFGGGAGVATGRLLGPPLADSEGHWVLVARTAGLEAAWKRQDGACRIGDQDEIACPVTGGTQAEANATFQGYTTGCHPSLG